MKINILLFQQDLSLQKSSDLDSQVKLQSNSLKINISENPPIIPKQSEKSILKTPKEIQNLKEACKIAGEAVRLALESVKIGTTTEDIDKVVHDYIVSQNAYPTPIGYMGFPKSVCTSVNEGKI